nr:MAG TPA_asm: hypothetical protein [Caudoviricetes sp.]
MVNFIFCTELASLPWLTLIPKYLGVYLFRNHIS